MRSFHSRENLLSLSLLLLFSFSGAPVLLASQDQKKKEAKEDLKKAKVVHGKLMRLLEGIDADVNQLPGMPWDVRVRAGTEGYDSQAIFTFVRDSIGNRPYVGVHRGTRGVLMSQAGNALEKAILLRDLLLSSGKKVRILSGTLSQQNATQWVDRFINEEKAQKHDALFRERTAAEKKAEQKALKDISAESGIPQDTLIQQQKRERAEVKRLWNRLWTLSSRHTQILLKALSRAKSRPKQTFASSRVIWNKRAQSHYWVELFEEKTQTWKALDPGFEKAKLGTRYGEDGVVLKNIPRSQIAQLEIRLILNRTRKEIIKTSGAEKIVSRDEKKVLGSVEIPIHKFLFDPVRLRFIPANLVADLKALHKKRKGKSAPSAFEMVNAFQVYQARVDVGAARYASRPFDLQGRVYDASEFGELKAIKSEMTGGMKGAGKALDKIFGTPPAKETKKSPIELRSISLQLTFHLPGQKPKVQMRTIYQRPKNPNKKYRALISTISIFIQPHAISADYVTFFPALWAARTREASIKMTKARAPRKPSEPPYPSRVYDFALLRQASIAKLLSQNAGTSGRLWDAPLCILNWEGTQLDPAAKGVLKQTVFDIVDNPAPIVPIHSGGGDSTWKANLTLGVLDSSSEGLLLAADGTSVHTDFGVRRFERSRLTGETIRIISPRQRAELLPSTFSKSDQKWIEKYTPHDSLLLVTGPKPSKTWWAVDPSTGSCLARVTGGGGEAQSSSQYPTLVTITEVKASFMTFLGCLLPFLIGATAGLIFMHILEYATGTDLMPTSAEVGLLVALTLVAAAVCAYTTGFGAVIVGWIKSIAGGSAAANAAQQAARARRHLQQLDQMARRAGNNAAALDRIMKGVVHWSKILRDAQRTLGISSMGSRIRAGASALRNASSAIR